MVDALEQRARSRLGMPGHRRLREDLALAAGGAVRRAARLEIDTLLTRAVLLADAGRSLAAVAPGSPKTRAAARVAADGRVSVGCVNAAAGLTAEYVFVPRPAAPAP